MDRMQIKKRIAFWYAILWLLLIIALFLGYGVYFVDLSSTKSKWIGLFAGAIAILTASCKMLEITYHSTKNDLSQKVEKYFAQGSFIFARRIFKIALVFVFLISCFLIKPLGVGFAASFITGSIFAFLAILVSIFATSKIATQISQFFNESNSIALKQIINSGMVISFSSVALAIIPVVILYHIFKDYQVINGFLLGSAFVVLLNNISTIISRQATKSANNVVCNYVAQIEKKDKRNPLLLLGGVTKNILNVDILSSDLFVSFAIALISAMTLGGECLMLMGAFLPIIIASSAIFACIIVALLMNFDRTCNLIKNLFTSMFSASVLFVFISYFLIKIWLPDLMNFVWPIAIGALGGCVVCFVHSNYIFAKYKPVPNIVNAAISGFDTAFKQTLRESFGGVIFLALIFALVIIASFLSSYGMSEPSFGVYGLMLAILSSLSVIGILIGVNSFAMVAKNSDNFLETYEENISSNQPITNGFFGLIGFNLVSLGKNFINFVSVLTSISALIAYASMVNLLEADILNPYVMSSLFIGAAIPFMYSGFIMGIVSKTARRLVLEVKRQFRKFPQILRFEMRPDYEKCVDISALNSSIQVVINTLIVVIIFALIAINLKKEALLGLVFGSIISTFLLLTMSNSCLNAAKSAKKHFESQFSGIRNTQEYEAIEENDEIFSSIGDVIIPPLSALIKLLAVLALVFAPLLI